MAGVSDQTIEQIIKSTRAEVISPDSWLGFCLAHNDKRKKSLAFWKVDDGTLAVKCYAGCRRHEVLQAIEDAGVDGLTKLKASIQGDDEEVTAKIGIAQQLWDQAKDVQGTPVEKYLHSRGLSKWPPGSVGYLHDRGIHSLINPILDHQARLQGVQRLFITAGGTKADVDPSRKINGTRRGGGVILPGTEPTVLCEGYETGLSVWAATGYQVVCTLGLANLDKLPLGSGMKVVIARDLDPHHSKADKGLWRAVRALRGRGVIVLVGTPDKYDDLKKSDFNDVLQRTGAERVKAIIDGAEEVDEADPAHQFHHKDLLDPIEATKRLNGRYLVVKDHGKTVVLEERRDETLQREMLVRLTFTDFRNYFLNQEVNLGTNVQPVSLGDYWLESPTRRQYDHVVFSPVGADPADYNLWRGWAYIAEAGNWSLLRDHMLQVVCSGRSDLFDYLIRWLARGVQSLDTPGQVAVVLRGKRGAGKGTLANAYGRLFGQHFLPVSHARHVTGNFNSHLRDCLFLFADEAFWAGDKQGESVLKALVTEATITIEAKGKDVLSDRNRVKLMVSSNHNWVVPAGMEERRFFVLDVNETQLQNTAYFTAIIDQLEQNDGQGYSGFLHDLMTFDLTDFNVFEVPATAALLDQKLASMMPHEKWWYECLVEGRLTPEAESWEQKTAPRTLHQSYVDWAKRLGIHRPLALSDLLRYVETMAPGAKKIRFKGRPEWQYIMSSLAAVRAQFETLVRQPMEWTQDIEETDEELEDDDIPF